MANDNSKIIKYMRENYQRFPLDLRPDVLDNFKKSCYKNGTTPTTEIKKFIDLYIKNNS